MNITDDLCILVFNEPKYICSSGRYKLQLNSSINNFTDFVNRINILFMP